MLLVERVDGRININLLADRQSAANLSIGCAPSTRPVQPGEDPRSQRLAGSVKTECGIPANPPKV